MSAGTDYMRVVNNLAIERRRQRLSQESVGVTIGRSQSTVAKWECGHTIQNAEELFQWARALGMSLMVERVFHAFPVEKEAA